MKITKRQLRQIIKEERVKILEGPYDITPEQEDALLVFEEAAAACVDARCDPKDMKDILRDALHALPSFDQQLGYE